MAVALIYDERKFTSRRYLVLLASKPQGSQDHGRVWAHRGDAFLLTEAGKIETVTSITDWLRAVGLMEEGKTRNLGGKFLIPSRSGLGRLDEMLHGSTDKENVK